MLPFCHKADRNADGPESSTHISQIIRTSAALLEGPPPKSSCNQRFAIECDETRVATLARSESILPSSQLQLDPKTWSCSCCNGWHPLTTVLVTENAHERNHNNDDEQATRQPCTPHLVDSSPPSCMVVGRLLQCIVAVAVVRGGGNGRVGAIRCCVCWQLLWRRSGVGGSHCCIHGLVVYRLLCGQCRFPLVVSLRCYAESVSPLVVQSSVFPKLLILE
jgi:hypothetical protein